jgi:hypothetical protein
VNRDDMESKEIIELQRNLMILSGRITAYEYALKILLLTHSDREWVKQIWRNLLPENVDQWSEHPGYANNGELRDALHVNLNDLHQFLEFDIPESDDDDD